MLSLKNWCVASHSRKVINITKNKKRKWQIFNDNLLNKFIMVGRFASGSAMVLGTHQ